MSANTKIEWADHTFNPWEGCQKVGPGCDHCYAEARNARFAGGTAINWGPGAPRRRTSGSNWNKPRAWNSAPFYECTCCGWRGDANDPEFKAPSKGCIHDLVPARPRVFCASLADVFDNAVDPQWRADLFTLIAATPNLDWLLLTKRVGNVSTMASAAGGWPANAWLGITVCNQHEADRDVMRALRVKAALKIGVLFLSMEPLLEAVQLWKLRALDFDESPSEGAEVYPLRGLYAVPDCDWPGPKVDWVIVGGESGPGARPMHPEWVRALRDQCQAAGVPFLFKQWGEWADFEHTPTEWWNGRTEAERRHLVQSVIDGKAMNRIGKKAAGRLLDGRTWDEVPA